jgi:hypothetical protein
MINEHRYRFIVKIGTSIDIYYGESLSTACKYGLYDIVKLFIENKASNDINYGKPYEYCI